MFKKFIVALSVIFFSPAVLFSGIEKFFIGSKEVSEYDYMALDSTMVRSRMTEVIGDTVIQSIELGLFFKIDTISDPGHTLVVRRSDAEIAAIQSFLSKQRIESARLKVGDTIPNFTFIEPFSDDSVNLKSVIKDKVVLLNFWATWCGPCLKELEETGLPSVVEVFKNDSNFVFLPVSVNHDFMELKDFFDSAKGEYFNWLKKEMLWDKNGEAEKAMSQGGIPLTVLIDRNGIIRLNESGAFVTEDQLRDLEAKIATALE